MHDIGTSNGEGTFGFEKYQCPFGYRFCSYENGQCRYHEDTWIAFGTYFSESYGDKSTTRNAMDPGNVLKCMGPDNENGCKMAWDTSYGAPNAKDRVDNGFLFSWTYRKVTCDGDCEIKCYHHQFWESSKTHNTPKVCCGTTARSVFISLYISLTLSVSLYESFGCDLTISSGELTGPLHRGSPLSTLSTYSLYTALSTTNMFSRYLPCAHGHGC